MSDRILLFIVLGLQIAAIFAQVKIRYYSRKAFESQGEINRIQNDRLVNLNDRVERLEEVY